MEPVREDAQSFHSLSKRWGTYVIRAGAFEETASSLRLVTEGTARGKLTDVQIDDYHDLPRRRHRWRPPLTMTVRARFSHPAPELTGTAGFGFWNDPFMMAGGRSPALPRALWFFYASPPSDMVLDLDTPGNGWKAATIDAARGRALLWAPLAPLLVPLMNVRPLYRRLWPRIQRALGVCERAIEVDMTVWHTYVLAWGERAVRFDVDGETVLGCDTSPRGPLGFVLWLDNQYMVVAPWGRFRYGWLEEPRRQWMEVERFTVEPGFQPPARMPQRGDER